MEDIPDELSLNKPPVASVVKVLIHTVISQGYAQTARLEPYRQPFEHGSAKAMHSLQHMAFGIFWSNDGYQTAFNKFVRDSNPTPASPQPALPASTASTQVPQFTPAPTGGQWNNNRRNGNQRARTNAKRKQDNFN